MRTHMRLLLGALLLLSAVVLFTDLRESTAPAEAAPFVLSVNPTSALVGQTTSVTLALTDASADAVLRWAGPVNLTAVPTMAAGTGGTPCVPTPTGPTEITYPAACLAATLNPGFSTSAIFQCTGLGQANFTLIQGTSRVASFECVAATPTPGTPVPTATPVPRDPCYLPMTQVSAEPPACAVVVTASPNVVACGGTSIITASLRDRDGHVMTGYGFHFATDAGLLTVNPNSADNTGAIAILQLFPPGSSGGPPTTTATVTVSVGLSLGTIQGTVTVQQYCPTSSTVAGKITLSASQANIPCGGAAFIAATLRDVNGNPVPDGTEIKLLASAGTIAPLTVQTKGGTANATYVANLTRAGSVTISAVSGATFGEITVNITGTCAAGGTGGTGAPAPACIPIGDNVCITPPNTGDAGMKR